MRKFLFGLVIGFCAVMAFGAVVAAEEPPVEENPPAQECSTGVINELGGCEPVGVCDPNVGPCEGIDSIDGPAVVDLPESEHIPFPYECAHGQDPVTYECYPEPATTGVSNTAASYTPQSLPETGAEHWYIALMGSVCFMAGIALCRLAAK